MKLLFSLVILFTIHCSLFTASAQSWQELMDSTDFYMEKEDYPTALQWAEKAEVQSKKEYGEKDTNYISSLTSIYLCYYYMGDAVKAIEYSEKVKPLIKEVRGEESHEYAEVVANLAVFYNNMGRYNEAEPFYKESLEIFRRLFIDDIPELVSTINNLASFYEGRGRFTEAEPLYKEALEMSRRIYKSDHPALALSINNIALFYIVMENYKEAEPLLKEALEMRRRIFKGDHPDLVNSLNCNAYHYNRRGRYNESEPLYKEALEMQRRLFKEDNPDLAQIMNNLAVFYINQGRYEEAEPLMKEALDMKRRIFKEDHPQLALTLGNFGTFYLLWAHYEEAELLLKEALEMSRRLYKGDNSGLADAKLNMASLYDMINNYSKAELLFDEALEMYRRIFRENHPKLAGAINNVANFYYKIGRYSKAEVFTKESLEMYRQLFKGDNKDLARVINNMATYLDERGNFAEAEPLYNEALAMKRRIFKFDHPDLANTITNIASFYIRSGRYEEAEPLLKESLNMCRRLFKADHPDLTYSLNNIAAFYNIMDRYAEAEPLYKEALEMRRRLHKEDNPELAFSINALAVFFDSHGRRSEAEKLFQEAFEMQKRLFKGDHDDVAKSIYDMARFYEDIDSFSKAEFLYKRALEKRRRLFKRDHPDLAQSISSMAYFYNGRKRYPEAESLYLELMEICYNMMNNYFPSLSEKEKEQYFNTFSKYYLRFNNFAVSRFKESPKMIETMFDNQLLTKGMLLSASNKVRRTIMSSNDTSLIELFSNWKDKKEYISKLYQLSKTQLEKKNINLDSIINSANELEKELTKRSDIFRKEYDKQKLSWKDVQNNLSKDEAIVEIVRLKYIEKSRATDTVYYAALIVKKNSKGPELVLLKDGKELEYDFVSNYYKSIQNQLEDKDSYSQFWEPIAKKLKGIKRVYISPDGVYNQINLATFQNPKTKKYVMDEIDVQVVGSTRDLVEKKMDSRFHGNDNLTPVVELFGDPMFNLDSTKHLELANSIAENRTRDFYYLGNTLDSTTRGGIIPLPSTRTEIEQIANEFTKKGWKVNTHLGEKALEEAVKGVDNPKVLHIATHGKFLKDIEVKDEDRMMGMETKRVAENPLLRPFLLFSGAENTLNDQKLDNQNTDDGLLTAYEAMNLNLDKTDLVVLSACETGLGEIKNGEGVYGLQRAFQQAGAKSIIMSLWTVPDKETQELMTSFYSKWLNGKDKRTAFNEARNEMRDKYHYPYYWGGFVMVGE